MHIHFKQQQESEQTFPPQYYRRVFKHLRYSQYEILIILQSIIQLRVGLGQRDIQHSDESLLDAGRAV